MFISNVLLVWCGLVVSTVNSAVDLKTATSDEFTKGISMKSILALFSTTIFFCCSSSVVTAASPEDYLVVPYVINPVASPATFRELARECMNNETCGAAVDAAASYVGVPPGTIKETMDTVDLVGLGPPKRRQEGEQYWYEIDPPRGYFLCRAHLKIISAAPLDGRRTPTFGFSAQETSGVDAYAFVHRQSLGKGRSWVEAVYTATYLKHSLRDDTDAQDCLYPDGQLARYNCKGRSCTANGFLTATGSQLDARDYTRMPSDDLNALPVSQLCELATAQLARLSPDNLNRLCVSALNLLDLPQLARLSPDNLNKLNAAQLCKLETVQFAILSPDNLNRLCVPALNRLDPPQLARLSPDNLNKLNASQLCRLREPQRARLSTGNLNILRSEGC